MVALKLAQRFGLRTGGWAALGWLRTNAETGVDERSARLANLGLVEHPYGGTGFERYRLGMKWADRSPVERSGLERGDQPSSIAALAKLDSPYAYRGHTQRDVLDLLDVLWDHGCTNVSADLMFGLPHQTTESWLETLERLVAYGVSKFNIFGLMFKQTDPVWIHRVRTPSVFPSDYDRLRMHFIAEHYLAAAGFRRGRLLYSKDEIHSRQQNSKYEDIEDVNLPPIGVSGFGYVGHTQYYNRCDLTEYMSEVEKHGLSIWRGVTLDSDERMRRHIMFAIRSRGVRLCSFKERYGVDLLETFREPINELLALGLLRTADDCLSLADRGLLCAEGIALRFASPWVSHAVAATNRLIDRNKSELETYDFSPIGR
jgi:oxygen-independent coproporphyrinogen III oxidase